MSPHPVARDPGEGKPSSPRVRRAALVLVGLLSFACEPSLPAGFEVVVDGDFRVREGTRHATRTLSVDGPLFLVDGGYPVNLHLSSRQDEQGLRHLVLSTSYVPHVGLLPFSHSAEPWQDSRRGRIVVNTLDFDAQVHCEFDLGGGGRPVRAQGSFIE